MSNPVLHVVAEAGALQKARRSETPSRHFIQLVPDVPKPPAKQLVLPGLSVCQHTLVSVGDWDLTYEDFLVLLFTYGIRRILDMRFVALFDKRGFPSTNRFPQEMAAHGVEYERPDHVEVELAQGPDGQRRTTFADNEVWDIVNRSTPVGIPDHNLRLTQYADTLLRRRVGLQFLRSRIEKGPLLLLGESELPPKRTEQDVLVDTLRVAFPDFAFDLVVYPRDNQWFPWMERGESPTAK
ncbi:MAG: hypothetical protein U0787_01745 [Polyangia bacterium]